MPKAGLGDVLKWYRGKNSAIVNSGGAPLLPGGSSGIPGNVFHVDSGHSAADDSGDGNIDKPFATVDYAIGQCTANNNDVIYVAAGHAETLSAAGAITCDIAGVTIVGSGNGSDRPAFTLDNTASTILVTAANVTIQNCVFINDVDALVNPFTVTAAYFSMIYCDMRDDTAAKQTIEWIIGSAAADNMEILYCTNRGSDTAGATAWITLNGADGVVILGCRSNGDFSAANIRVVTAAVTDCLIAGNYLENANAVDVNIEGFAAATGWIAGNNCRIATDGQTTWVNTGGAMSLFENYGVNNDAETGKLVGTVSV